MPEIIAYYIANSFNRNSLYSGTFDQYYNSTKDMLNLFNEDYEAVKKEVFKLLKMKYDLIVTNKEPLKLNIIEPLSTEWYALVV